MGILAQITLGVLAIAFMIFVAFFGRLPALRHTPIAWLHRFIWVSIPSGILALDTRLTGGRFTSWLGQTGHFIMYGRHPTVLIFFLALLIGGEALFLPGAWPRLNLINKILGIIVIALPYIFLYLSAHTDPGTIITPLTQTSRQQSISSLSSYPYDFALFHPGQKCRTCDVLKPARSKHCSVCGRCVAKMDHHCVFINNCVGYNNQRWFILLLLSTAVLTSYGAGVGLSLVSASVRRRRPTWSLWKPASATKFSWGDWLLLFTMGVQDDVGIGSVTLLTMMTTPLVWGLLVYTLYLVYCGTTTNESMKWQDWQAEMDDGCAFKRALPPNRRKDLRVEAESTRWPVEPVQVLVRTEDGRPPAVTSGPGVGEWERVWKLRDVENLYDLGFWDNLVDVFALDHSFRDEVEERPSPSSLPPLGMMDGTSHNRAGGKVLSEEGDLETGSGRRKMKKTRKPKVAAAASLVNAAT